MTAGSIEKEIAEENWRKAEGVIYHRGETNAALAERDYSKECVARKLLLVIEGYHLWWCSTHHQPHRWCECAKLLADRQSLEERIKELEAEKCPDCETSQGTIEVLQERLEQSLTPADAKGIIDENENLLANSEFYHGKDINDLNTINKFLIDIFAEKGVDVKPKEGT